MILFYVFTTEFLETLVEVIGYQWPIVSFFVGVLLWYLGIQYFRVPPDLKFGSYPSCYSRANCEVANV